MAGPAPVGLTTIAGQPAITIRELLGKKSLLLTRPGPHSKVLGRRKLGSLVLVLLGLSVGPRFHRLTICGNSNIRSRSLKCEEKKQNESNGRLCIPTEISNSVGRSPGF